MICNNLLNSSRVSFNIDFNSEKADSLIISGFINVEKSYPIDIGVYVSDFAKFLYFLDILVNGFGVMFILSAPHL